MIKVEIEDKQFIEFDDQTCLFFYGNNQELREALIRSLKRFSTKKALNPLEELVYGENGIEIYRDNEPLNAKNIDFYFLQDNLSIYQEVELSKSNLLTDYIKKFGQDVAVNVELEEIKNRLLKLEIIFNEKLKAISDNISINLGELTFDDLLKNHLFLSYFNQYHDYPLEMMNAGELVDEYVKLLADKMDFEPKESWIILINPESFLSKKSLDTLLEGLYSISEKSALLKILVISNQVIDIDYNTEHIEQTIILADKVYQLPDFYHFRKSIENHYPDHFNFSDKKLCQMFYQIVENIGEHRKNIYGKAGRNMVLLKVVNELLGLENPTSFEEIEDLSVLEKAYLFAKD